jgi:uncharacterized protein (DUF983 family)
MLGNPAEHEGSSFMSWTTGPERPQRDLWRSLLRGLAGRCPACGKGSLFRAYLKVADACPHCGEELHHQRADDAPAYFVILIVGHLIVPLALSLELAMEPPYWLHALLWAPLAIGLSLALLPALKGAIVGWQWGHRMHGFDPAGDPDLLVQPVPQPSLAGRP